MWLPLTQVLGLADKVMVCRGWGHPVPSNPCYQQEEGKRMAGMLSSHCHQQPPQQTSSSHSPAELELGLRVHLGSHSPLIRDGRCNDTSPPCVGYTAVYPPLAFLVTLASIWVSILVSHSNPEVSHDRIQLHYSFPFFSDSISKAQLKILSFPMTRSNHSLEM